MMSLTPQQRACKAAIKELTVGGVCPTFEQLRVRLGLASKSGVSRCIDGLIERGHLRKMPGRYRALEVVEPAVDPYSVAGLSRLTTESLRRIDGRIQAMLRERAQ